METRRVLLVDAFTDEPLAGNAAGVVPNAEGLSEERMGRVAAELGASETAFLTEPSTDSDADRRVRYFTPTTEVDLCGHATVASYAALTADGVVGADATGSETTDHGSVEETLETNVGDLAISVDDETVWMRQSSPG